MAVPKRFKFKKLKKSYKTIYNNQKFVLQWKNNYILSSLKI